MNQVSTLKKQNITLGGRAKDKGSLTQDKIGTLQSYYTKAVRTYNSSVEEMSRAIWAAYYHSVSTDEHPQHHLCPAGPDSWCWYQNAVAGGQQHPTGAKKSSTYLSSKVAIHVKPIYERLTNPDLLKRCLLGATQNANESLHSMIWSRCQKHLFAGYKRVQIATVLGVGEFNKGSTATRQFLAAVGCINTSATVILGHKRDLRRINKAEEAEKEVSKVRREKRKLAQQRVQEAAEAAEGGPSLLYRWRFLACLLFHRLAFRVYGPQVFIC